MRRRNRIRSRKVSVTTTLPSDEVETLISRAMRMHRRGEERKALVLLRHASALDTHRARTWTLLGVLASQAGFGDEAKRALRHAEWLRGRAGDTARVDVTRMLLRKLEAA
jgi:Flp pilus assembly protein TadD